MIAVRIAADRLPSPTRGDSASRRPFSAIRQWPPKTTSVVDSDGPAAGHRIGGDARPDWPTTRSVRYRLLPIVSLLAERLSRIVAPAIAWSELGGIGTQRSSQISTPTTNAPEAGIARGLDASNSRSMPNGTARPPSSISGGSVPSAG